MAMTQTNPASFFRTMLAESEAAIEECREQVLDNAICYFFLDAQFCKAFEEEFGMTPEQWIATPEAKAWMKQETDSLLRRDHEELRYQAKRRLYRF